MTRNKLFDKFQSGFCSSHSTEKALIWVTNLAMAADAGSPSLLLGLSSAFDTIDHNILQNHFFLSLGLWYCSWLAQVQTFGQDWTRCHWRSQVKDTYSHLWGSSRVSPWPYSLHIIHATSCSSHQPPWNIFPLCRWRSTLHRNAPSPICFICPITLITNLHTQSVWRR